MIFFFFFLIVISCCIIVYKKKMIVQINRVIGEVVELRKAFQFAFVVAVVDLVLSR